ncbi:hypothetical protein G9A89_005708 [Geosiphon pyriformis]|nr:hypothetical protein G9A89_005708 [Geosiphon pyriformis]
MEMTKNDWQLRKVKLVPFQVTEMKTNFLIRVDEEYYNDVVSISRSLFGRICAHILRARNELGVQVFFIGHGVGGAYAAIAGLMWQIETGIGSYPKTYPNGFYSSENYHVVTFGQPRTGNVPFAKMVNTLLDVTRITHTNDPASHFPPAESGIDFLGHHDYEFWLATRNCDCPGDVPSEKELVNEYAVYSCPGYFLKQNETKRVKKQNLLFEKRFFEVEDEESGENQECSIGQSISELPNNYIHKGRYFGVTMNDCINFRPRNLKA